jgi:large subunit ribosomal protein L35
VSAGAVASSAAKRHAIAAVVERGRSSEPAPLEACDSFGLIRPTVDVATDPLSGRHDEQDFAPMPKLKTHKGTKKRFKVSANGKVSHKRCGSSHLMSHKNGKQVRRLRKKSLLKVEAEAHRLRRAVHKNEGVNPVAVEQGKQAALADRPSDAVGEAPTQA